MKNCPYDGMDGDPFHIVNGTSGGWCNEDEPWKCMFWDPGKYFCPHLKKAREEQKLRRYHK